MANKRPKRPSSEERRESFLNACEKLAVDWPSFIKVFTIDPGRANCGWATFDKQLVFGSIAPVKQRSSFRKVVLVTDEIRELLVKFKPNIVLMEDYAYGTKQGRELAGEIQGCIQYWLVKMNLPLIKPAPSQIKGFIGAQVKSKIMMEVLSQYRMKVRNDDEADAVVLAMLGKVLFKIARIVNNEAGYGLKNDHTFNKHFRKICKDNGLVTKQADVIFTLIRKKGNSIWL